MINFHWSFSVSIKLNPSTQKRSSVNEEYLDPVRSKGRITVKANTVVRRVFAEVSMARINGVVSKGLMDGYGTHARK